MTSNTTQNDALYGKNYGPFQVTASPSGNPPHISIPRNSIWDFRTAAASIVTASGTLLDNSYHENVVQGTTLTNPNTVSESTTRSVMLADQNCTLTGDTCLAIIASSLSNLATSTQFDAILASLSCSINSTSIYSTILGGRLSSISNRAATTSIISSYGSQISAPGATGTSYTSCSINACDACSFTNNLVTTTLDADGIYACTGCNFTASTNEKVNGPRALALVGCTTCYPTASGSGTMSNNAIVGSVGSTLASNSSGTFSSNTIMASQGGTISTNAAGTATLTRCSHIASLNGTITQTGATVSQQCALVGSETGTISNCTNGVGTGLSPNITGFNNVFAHNATATASNQAIFGSRLDVTGTGNNLTIGGGYVNSLNGYLSPFRVITGGGTLVPSDHTILLNTGTLTIPTAASFSSNYPTETVREFIIFKPVNGTTPVIQLSGSDNFFNMTNWTNHTLSSNGEIVRIGLVCYGTPQWTIQHANPYTCTAVAPLNSFGTPFPKSDASQLPTSTNEADHYTKTADAWARFTTVTSNNSGVFSLNGALNTVANGMWMRIDADYTVIIKTATGAGEYLIRADLCMTSGATLGGYAETGGTNTVGGTRTLRGRIVGAELTNNITVRITQDATNTINASANIYQVVLNISRSF